MRSPLPLPLLAALALSAACLETEEEITVRADGSLHVVVTASGDSPDVATGYPLPVEGPWVAADEATRAWRAAASARPGEPVDMGVPPEDDVTLSVSATFARVEDLPASWAPASDPYADTSPTRDATLTIEEKGSRTVYVFERRLHGRTQQELYLQPVREEVITGLDEGIQAKVDEEIPLTEDELLTVHRALQTYYGLAAEDLARNAIAAVYTLGEADLSVGAAGRVVRGVRAAVEGEVRLEALLEYQARVVAGVDEADLSHPVEEFEERGLGAIRAQLPALLDTEGMAPEVVNAVLGRLEWLLADRAHTGDLKDETQVVRVRMPGAIVGGNFGTLEDGAAVWRVPGGDLEKGDAVLRVVSVLEE